MTNQEATLLMSVAIQHQLSGGLMGPKTRLGAALGDELFLHVGQVGTWAVESGLEESKMTRIANELGRALLKKENRLTQEEVTAIVRSFTEQSQ